MTKKKLVVIIAIAVLIMSGIYIAYTLEYSEKAVQKDVLQMIKYIRNNNGYINVVEGENASEIYIYNKNNEAVAQSNSTGNISVFRKDGTSVRYTDKVSVSKDADIMTLIENTIKLVNDKKATIKSSYSKPDDIDVNAAKSQAAKTFKYYAVDINGWDNIQSLYEYTDKIFAVSSVESMKRAVGNDVEDIRLTFTYIIGNNKEFSAGCNISYNNKNYILWYIDGYILMNEWQLNNDWYTYDFNNEDTEKAEEILDNQMTDIKELFDKYANENGLEVKE